MSPQLLAAALSLAESSEPGSVVDKENQIVQHAPKTLSSDPHLPQPNEPCTEQEQALFDQWGVQEPTLTRAQKLAIVRVLEKNKEVFAKDSWDLGECKLAKHHIDTGSAAPIHCNPHRLAFALRETLREELNEMLRGGIIEPSESAWAAPVTYVPKADGSWRLCVDFRKLNAVVKPCVYPLPRIEDIFDSLEGARYFSSLDLARGFLQVALDDESKEKAAFTCFFGQFQYRRLPFGLATAPGAFQKVVNTALAGLDMVPLLGVYR